MEYEGFAMEQREQRSDPERARAAFNLVALHLAGYTYDQIELFYPANMTSDRLHELLDRKMASLVGTHAKIEAITKPKVTPNDQAD
ncbi:MAG: hypothetical protein ACLP5V_10710 [Candidatus Bathyarchaeia archaeon]